jgi:hypothetical protein
VPWQFQVLTFPEQLLIALLYPWVFMFKLFPKKIGGVHPLFNVECMEISAPMICHRKELVQCYRESLCHTYLPYWHLLSP